MVINTIDEYFQTNATWHHYPFLANVTLDWGCGEDAIELNIEEILSVPLNGTFIDENSNKPT